MVLEPSCRVCAHGLILIGHLLIHAGIQGRVLDTPLKAGHDFGRPQKVLTHDDGPSDMHARFTLSNKGLVSLTAYTTIVTGLEAG